MGQLSGAWQHTMHPGSLWPGSIVWVILTRSPATRDNIRRSSTMKGISSTSAMVEIGSSAMNQYCFVGGSGDRGGRTRGVRRFGNVLRQSSSTRVVKSVTARYAQSRPGCSNQSYAYTRCMNSTDVLGQESSLSLRVQSSFLRAHSFTLL